MSRTAAWRIISTRISSGSPAIGQAGGGERSVGGASPWIESDEKSSIRDESEAERPYKEWWAVLGTVTGALDGFTSCGFILGGG